MNIRKVLIITGMLSLGILSGCTRNTDVDTEKIVDEKAGEDSAINNNQSGREQDNNQQADSLTQSDEMAKEMNRPVFVAHRGYSAIAPDNSMASFQAASDFGADMIELDVQMTLDGYIIVYHDLNLENVTGETGKSSEYTYEELMQYRINEKYEAATGTITGCGYTGYADEKIPTLNEVMRFARDNGIGVDIEIKSVSDVTEYSEEEVTWFLTEIVKIVEENEMTGNTVFSTFNYNYIREIEDMNPEYVTFFLTNVLNMEAFEGDFVADGVALYYGCLQSDTIERMHNVGKEVYVWTVDNLEMMKKLTDMGVDGIITDNLGMIEYFEN